MPVSTIGFTTSERYRETLLGLSLVDYSCPHLYFLVTLSFISSTLLFPISYYSPDLCSLVLVMADLRLLLAPAGVILTLSHSKFFHIMVYLFFFFFFTLVFDRIEGKKDYYRAGRNIVKTGFTREWRLVVSDSRQVEGARVRKVSVNFHFGFLGVFP